MEAGRGDSVMFYCESAYTKTERAWTFREIHNHVGRLASIYKKKFGLVKGDRVLIYMPMIVEAACAALAAARLGVIHSIVFGGFAAKELASRIDDCRPKLIVTASYGLEPNKNLAYPPIVEEAMGHCKWENAKDTPRLIKQRLEMDGKLVFKDLPEG